MMQLVVASAVLTLAAQIAGLGDVGGVLALIHLGGLIGAPLAMILNRHLRSVPAAMALSVALSIALSALAVQSLIWFELAGRLLLVVVGTAYGLALAGLLIGNDPRTATAPPS
jgi:hypothetical protein